MLNGQSFIVGQIVKLNSGGPEMTVQKVHKGDDGKVFNYRCQWFAGKKLESGIFPEDSLIVVDPKNDK